MNLKDMLPSVQLIRCLKGCHSSLVECQISSDKDMEVATKFTLTVQKKFHRQITIMV
jgi:hypothetical protein